MNQSNAKHSPSPLPTFDHVARLHDHTRLFSSMGIKTVPFYMVYSDGKKQPHFDGGWKHKNYTICDIKAHHNALAIKTGEVSGIFILDFDLSGVELANLLAYYRINLADYCHYNTPSGGVHIMLSTGHNEYWKSKFNLHTLTTTNKALGVDVRADGAIAFTVPTSIAGYGDYSWGKRPESISDFSYQTAAIDRLMWDIYQTSRHAVGMPVTEVLDPNFSIIKTISSEEKSTPVEVQTGKTMGDNDQASETGLNSNAFPSTHSDDWAKAERIVSVLAQIPIDYDDWIKVGMALRAGFGERGKTLWDYFLSNPNYKDSQRQLDCQWHSFRGVTRITLASLFYIAEKYGIKGE